jgi:predicted RNase H-like HicB family nuclease
LKTYIFPIEMVESDGAWHVCVPELEHKGAATWGTTQEEALRNIQEVIQMVAEEMLEDGESLPPTVRIADQTSVAISV